MTEYTKRYEYKTIEPQLMEAWANSDTYTWDETLDPSLDYVIDTPPPTVSGTLHVGHVYSYTQADILARYFRMSGRNVLYPIGWDDNGLPTERLVEKVKKIRGGNMAREEFVAICQDVIPEYEQEFRGLFSRLGLSVDWDREYQTISPESRAMSQLSFLDLFDKGVLERRLEPTLWDPADRTAIAQAEVEEMEKVGQLNTVSFGVEGGGTVEIATTRPELLAGCAAMMIHPTHPRAEELVGKNAISPLYGALVPILAEDTVDPEKGTGVVMCCTFGDVNDIAWYRTHRLPLRLVIDSAGKMLDDVAIGDNGWPCVDAGKAKEMIAALAGKKVKAARAEILEMLQASGDLKEQVETNQIVPIAERSGAPLEIIVTPQWFIKTLDYKEQLLEKGREIRWHPESMRNRYETWVNGLKWDWAISRQRHFGVPLPVWYSKRPGEEGKVLLPTQDQLPIDPLVDLPHGYTADEVTPEKDVFDTWATSSVSPQIISRAISPERGYDTEQHKRFFPSAMRPQAHEIIRTWAFYTIVKSLHHQNEVPWRDICISGWCLAADGTKMSKSKGNIVDPIKMLDQYGTDAVRYWTGTSRLGNDTTLSPNTLKQGNRLVNKLWNASRLAHTALEGRTIDAVTPKADIEAGKISHPLDVWLLGALADTIKRASDSFEKYEYANAFKTIEEFFWNANCDNYLELVKHRVHNTGDTPTAKELSALHTLLHVTRTTLRLFAPLMPFVTETLGGFFTLPSDEGRSIHTRGNWPDLADFPEAGTNAAVGKATMATLSAMRKVKSNLDVSMRAEVSEMFIWAEDADLATVLGGVIADLSATSSADKIVFAAAGVDVPFALAASEELSVGLALKPKSDA